MTYTDAEYQQHLSGDNWSRSETDHLMELAKRFDMRFVVMHDRWNRDKFPKRSVEDLKERYYNISNTLVRVCYCDLLYIYLLIWIECRPLSLPHWQLSQIPVNIKIHSAIWLDCFSDPSAVRS